MTRAMSVPGDPRNMSVIRQERNIETTTSIDFDVDFSGDFAVSALWNPDITGVNMTVCNQPRSMQVQYAPRTPYVAGDS